MKIIRPKEDTKLAYLAMQDLPKTRPGVIYVRQSKMEQKERNVHSYEMQTGKFVQHFRDLDFTGPIEIIEDDEGTSGTLDIHNRLGMMRLLHLIETGAVAWIAGVAINRFTRDKWLITPGVLMKKCYEHDVWVLTLKMHFNFKDEYCKRFFMMEAEEAARQLDWMKLALGGGRIVASNKGFYDGRFLPAGYTVDNSNHQEKRIVIYGPHAEVVRWLFKRFMELDGKIIDLCRELEAMLYVFPKFDTSIINPLYISKAAMTRSKNPNRTPEGHFKLSKNGLIHILTNYMYIGWWTPCDGGVIENNHPAIVDETLFVYAHKILSTTELDGTRKEGRRGYTRTKAEALLKDKITGPRDLAIYAYAGKGGIYECIKVNNLKSHEYQFAIKYDIVDEIFSRHLLEMLDTWTGYDTWEDKPEEKVNKKEQQTKAIQAQIAEAEANMEAIVKAIEDKETPPPASLKVRLYKDYAEYEQKKKRLDADLKECMLQNEDTVEQQLYKIGTLLPDIIENWYDMEYPAKLKIVNALVDNVILDHCSTCWYKLTIEWRREDWGVHEGYWYFKHNGGSPFSHEEDTIIRELYPYADSLELMKKMPHRSWQGIRARASVLGVTRKGNVLTGKQVKAEDKRTNQGDLSLSDQRFMQENNVLFIPNTAQWHTPLSWGQHHQSG